MKLRMRYRCASARTGSIQIFKRIQRVRRVLIRRSGPGESVPKWIMAMMRFDWRRLRSSAETAIGGVMPRRVFLALAEGKGGVAGRSAMPMNHRDVGDCLKPEEGCGGVSFRLAIFSPEFPVS